MSDPRPAVLAPDTVFHGRYRVLRLVRAGAMGAVHEVVDQVTNARRALKVMLPGVVSDPDLRARFALEARITGDVESDHIVRVSDAGVDEATGTPFLVMDLLRGEDLGSVLAQRGAVPAAQVVTYLSQVALALDKTHAAGIVHRDLKPDNLFVTRRDDGSVCVKVLDFGIAKIVEPDQTNTTKPVGTPLYMAPEQIRGDRRIGSAIDIHAIGHIAFTLLTGKPYWDDEQKADPSTFGLLTAIVAGPKEPPVARARRRGATLPAGFDGWFARATAADPGARFAEATHAVAALAEVLGVPSPLAQATPADPAERRGAGDAAMDATEVASSTLIARLSTRSGGLARSRRRWVLVAAGVALALAGAAVALLLRG